MKAHPAAIVSKKAQVADNVEIGPFAIVEDDVKIETGVRIYANAHILNGTSIGPDTQVHMGAVLGHLPQDLSFEGKPSYLKIGKKNVIREYVTIHRGTQEESSTIIGEENFFMALSHVGHNCNIGNKVIVSNGALLAGYITVEDGVFVSGNVVVHQYCRIGRLAMIGGFSGVNKDVPPYMMVRGPSSVWSVNLVGLRRAGFKRDVIKEIKEAYKLIYQSGFNTAQAIEKILAMKPSRETKHLVDFIKNSKRGICKYRYTPEDEEYFG